MADPPKLPPEPPRPTGRFNEQWRDIGRTLYWRVRDHLRYEAWWALVSELSEGAERVRRTPEQQHALALSAAQVGFYDMRGLDQKQIAAELDMGVRTVKRRQALIRAAFSPPPSTEDEMPS